MFFLLLYSALQYRKFRLLYCLNICIYKLWTILEIIKSITFAKYNNDQIHNEIYKYRILTVPHEFIHSKSLNAYILQTH